MNKPFNQLTPAQAERLALLAEECAEVIQAITKIQRHGYGSRHPQTGVLNSDALVAEIGDLFAAVDIMRAGGDVDGVEINDAKRAKLSRVWAYLHEQPPGLPDLLSYNPSSRSP